MVVPVTPIKDEALGQANPLVEEIIPLVVVLEDKADLKEEEAPEEEI